MHNTNLCIENFTYEYDIDQNAKKTSYRRELMLDKAKDIAEIQYDLKYPLSMKQIDSQINWFWWMVFILTHLCQVSFKSI